MTKNATASTSQAANSKLDAKLGGRNRRKTGGQSWTYSNNPDWNWGCKSGGNNRRTHKRKTKRVRHKCSRRKKCVHSRRTK